MSTQYTFDVDSYSDLYKDVFGFRPRDNYAWWMSLTDDQKQAEWDDLVARLGVVMKEEEEHEKRCIAEFEETVAKTIENGAGDRETALRWLLDADKYANGDWEFFCYNNGLPYGYFNKKAA